MANEYITRQAVRDTARAIYKDPILIMAADAVAKTAPGVEVVRCKDCGGYNTSGCADGFGWCEHLDRGMMDNDFCSHGGRRVDGD